MSWKRIFANCTVVSMLAMPAFSQTVAERVAALDDEVEKRKSGIEDALGVELHALVSTTYNYAINGGDSIGMRVFNDDQNAFDLRDAVLTVSRMREDENFGFAIVMDFGKTAAQGNGSIYGSTDVDIFDVREAYLTWKTPLTMPNGAPITLQAGKFVTLLGWEVLLDPLNEAYNDNITLSLLSGFSIPFTHTGLLANIPLSDVVDLNIGVVNGNDFVEDNNNSKTLLAGIGIAPADNLEFYVAGTYGAEEDPLDDGGVTGEGSKTGIVTANAFFQATDQLAFVIDGTFADVSDINLLNGKNGGNWYGAGAYALISLSERLQLTLRGEIFDDPDGIKTGVIGRRPGSDSIILPAPPTAISSLGTTLWEVSPAISYWFNDHVLLRAEYRHDESTHPLFSVGDGIYWRGQDVFSFELLLTI